MSNMFAHKSYEPNAQTFVNVIMRADDARRVRCGLRRLLQLHDDTVGSTDLQDAIDLDACADLLTALDKCADT
jgi:hypothetical protein